MKMIKFVPLLLCIVVLLLMPLMIAARCGCGGGRSRGGGRSYSSSRSYRSSSRVRYSGSKNSDGAEVHIGFIFALIALYLSEFCGRMRRFLGWSCGKNKCTHPLDRHDYSVIDFIIVGILGSIGLWFLCNSLIVVGVYALVILVGIVLFRWW